MIDEFIGDPLKPDTSTFDPDRMAIGGDARPVLPGVLTKANGAVDYAVADEGSIVYVPGESSSPGGSLAGLVWVDRRGTEEPTTAPPRTYQNLSLSPDGTAVALDVRDEDNDIWVWHFTRRNLTRFTVTAGVDGFPVWTPDGKQLIFESHIHSVF